MKTDFIKRIEIDSDGRLLVAPSHLRLPFVYREAAEVSWDENGAFLYSPTPRQWSYFEWFMHIMQVAKQLNCDLQIASTTIWVNVPDDLRRQIQPL